MLTLITLYPIGVCIYNSLFHYTFLGGLPKFIGLGNYGYLIMRDSLFHSAALFSACYTLVGIAVEFLLGLVIALLLWEEFRGRNTIRALFMLPFILIPIAMAYGWRIMLHPSIGVINYLLGTVGLQQVNWLGSSWGAKTSVIMVEIWENAPFLVLFFSAGLSALATEPFEAARIDGASTWQVFRYITLPLLRPVLILATLFRVLDAYNKNFDIIGTLTGGGPGRATENLVVYTWNKAFLHLDMGYSATLAIVMLIIILVPGIFMIRATKLTA